MAGSLSFLGLFTQEAILAFSRWVWIDGERAATLGKDHERRESGRYSLGRRSGRTCPLWPSCRKPCGKHEGESLKHKKGVDRRVGRGVAGRQGYSDAGPGSAGRSATDGPQPCPSGDLCPLLTCSAWVYHTIFCFFLCLSHLIFLAVYQDCQREHVPCSDLGSLSRGKSILLESRSQGPVLPSSPRKPPFLEHFFLSTDDREEAPQILRLPRTFSSLISQG